MKSPICMVGSPICALSTTKTDTGTKPSFPPPGGSGTSRAVMSAARVFLVTILVTAGLMLQTWLVSVMKKDVSIIDVVWGLGFVAINWAAFGIAHGAGPRSRLIAELVSVWGLRLGVYLLWRNWGTAEDYRYRALRARHGERFTWVSLYLVFGLQAALMWVVSLPLQVAAITPRPDHLTWLDGAG